ncbi:MAG: porin [Gammaproteobacteria bacterium]|nr:porin [Gammaproteobacteria bacterium]MBU2057073.1 porin [Gammaproteobacteria bacterium]MBU2175132.1 porin [Gammaproteobacteria bacterium]MBU2245163.1 porin [Gammaproteobacteria bacterium]MBU2343970.1 porin [Gammaproteobacteria bacterium]
MKRKHSVLLWMASIASLTLGAAHATQPESKVSLSGFGSIAVNHLSNNSGFFKDTEQGFDFKSDSLFGLKSDFEINDKSDASIQLLSKGAEDWSTDIEWAYISYAITPSMKVRGGKLRLPLFMYSDFLDARFSLPWVRPPQEVYSVIPTSSYTGGELNYEKAVGGFNFNVQLYLGGAEPENLVSGAESELSELRGVTLSLAGEVLTFRASYARSHIDLTLDNITKVPAGVYESNASFIGLGALYDDGTWLVVAEAVESKIGALDISDISSAYLTAGKRMGDWMPYVTLAKTRNSSDFPDPLTQQFFASKRQSVSLGLRWDLARGMSLKSELTHLYGFDGTSGLLRHNAVASFDKNGQLTGFDFPYDSVSISSISLDVIF